MHAKNMNKRENVYTDAAYCILHAMAKPVWKKGKPLPDPLQEKLRALVQERGEVEVAEQFGIGQSSIVRAAAGLGLRRGTIRVIELGLKGQAA
jgi:hypothetical protein